MDLVPVAIQSSLFYSSCDLTVYEFKQLHKYRSTAIAPLMWMDFIFSVVECYTGILCGKTVIDNLVSPSLLEHVGKRFAYIAICCFHYLK